MVELRWTVPEGTTTRPPVLQWRLLVAVDASGAFSPCPAGDWRDVPTEVVPPLRAPALYPRWYEFKTAKQQGLMAGDGKPCLNDHDPDCRWPKCHCRRA